MEMVVEGVCAIAAGDSPTVVREKMQAFVPAGRREEVKATV
jgi:flagellar motor component MotA